MTSFLPVELLRLVLDNFQLPSFSSYRRTRELEDETRSTLYNLCIASHTFRQIAQPLLFQFVRIWDKEQLLQLVENNRDNDRWQLVNTLEMNLGVILSEKEPEVDPRIISSFSQTIKVAILNRPSQIRYFSGTTLTRLFLTNIELKPETIANTHFPSLEVLGMKGVIVASGILAADLFPRLLHLAIFDGDFTLDEEDMALMRRLARRLEPISLLSEAVKRVLSEVPDLRSRSILFNLPWDYDTDWAKVGDKVVHLRLLVSHSHREYNTDDTCDQAIDAITSNLGTHCPNLESLYLPPFDSLPPGYRTDKIVNSLRSLALTCQQRNIELVFDEQSDKEAAESQISEEFMRRMTKKRIEQ